MSYERLYGNLIWTNHALERLSERRISQEHAYRTYKSPDRIEKGKNPGSIRYIKKFDEVTLTLVTKKNERNQWIVLSVWIDPPLPGTRDYQRKEDYKNYKKAGFWGKMFYILKRQMGL